MILISYKQKNEQKAQFVLSIKQGSVNSWHRLDVDYNKNMPAYFELYQDKKGEWRWRFYARNGKIIADSAESYKNKEDAKHAIEIIKKESPIADIKEPSNKNWGIFFK